MIVPDACLKRQAFEMSKRTHVPLSDAKMSCFLLLLLYADPPKAEILLPKVKPGETQVIRVTGLTSGFISKWKFMKHSQETWTTVFRVVVAGETEFDTFVQPAVLGTYRLDGNDMVFEPRFPLAPGTPYRITFNPSILHRNSEPWAQKNLLIPKPDAPPASVQTVYPSADVLPENTLRMYLHFSAPMSGGDIYKHITLTKADGTKVVKPFIEIDEELWNPAGTRLTLLFDPGRIKHGLKSREEAGPNLEAGQTYTLTISKDWKDANGRPLAGSFKKTFKAGPIDDTPVSPEKWKLNIPAANSRKPFVIELPKAHDRALLGRFITITDPHRRGIENAITISEHETKWTFVPTRPWQAGTYTLHVDTRLEDICGNRVGSPFEIDVFRPATRRLEAKFVTREFVVK